MGQGRPREPFEMKIHINKRENIFYNHFSTVKRRVVLGLLRESIFFNNWFGLKIKYIFVFELNNLLSFLHFSICFKNINIMSETHKYIIKWGHKWKRAKKSHEQNDNKLAKITRDGRPWARSPLGRSPRILI